jgi:hypothetical protein|tara:strand:+ start:196 stop:972 length:777 start_codon:yes stop_codon:yes gene_type:complete
MKICIGLPCYGNQMSLTTFNSLNKLFQYFWQNKIEYATFTLGQESLIPRARNFLASQMLNFKKIKFTHLLFIDADIGFDVNNFLRLVKIDKDIVCGIYPKKKIEWKNMLRKIKQSKNLDEEFLKASSLKYAVNFEDVKNIKIIDGFAKVKNGGTGFMLIKRHVFEKMIENYPEIKYETNDYGTLYDFFKTGVIEDYNSRNEKKVRIYASEDYYFCLLWRKLKGEIWADVTSPFAHFGNHEFRGQVYSDINVKIDDEKN